MNRMQPAIGVNAAGDAGDTSPAIFGQPGTKCLTPPKFVKIVIKLPAERCNQRLRFKQDTQTFKERVIVLILHELRRNPLRTFRMYLHVGMRVSHIFPVRLLLVPANVPVLTPLQPAKEQQEYDDVETTPQQPHLDSNLLRRVVYTLSF